MSSEDNLDGMTYAELVQHVEKLEESVRLKNEAVFQRVLDSLGGPMDPSQMIVSNEAMQIIQESKLKREQQKLEQQKKIDDEIERKRLEEERERLRKRFDQDSEDAVGENPLPNKAPSDLALSEVSLGPVELDSVFGGEEFDALLSELEKELETQAVGKDDGKLSELGEILSILDSEATKRKKAPPSSASHRTPASSVDMTKKESQGLEEDAKGLFPLKYAFTNSNPPPHFPPAPPTPLAAPSPHPLPPVAPVSLTAPLKSANQNQAIEGRAGGRSAYYSRTRNNDAEEREEEEEEAGESSEEEGGGDWRSRRKQFKEHHVGVMGRGETSFPPLPPRSKGGRVEEEGDEGERVGEREEEEQEEGEEEEEEEEEFTEDEEEREDEGEEAEEERGEDSRGETEEKEEGDGQEEREDEGAAVPTHTKEPASLSLKERQVSPSPPTPSPPSLLPTPLSPPPSSALPTPSSPPTESEPLAPSALSGSLLSGSLSRSAAPAKKGGKRAVLSSTRTTFQSTPKPSRPTSLDPLPISTPSPVLYSNNVAEDMKDTKDVVSITLEMENSSAVPTDPADSLPPVVEREYAVKLTTTSDAPYLPPFPAAGGVEKHRGLTCPFPYSTSFVQSLELNRVVAIALDCCLWREGSDCGSICVVEHLVRTLVDYDLLSLFLVENMFYVVFTSKSQDVYVNTIQYMLDTVSLSSLVSNLEGMEDVKLSSVCQVLEYNAHPQQLLHILSALAPQALHHLPVSPHIDVGNSCAVVLKEHVAQQWGGNVVTSLVEECEQAGLRLVTLRLVYLSSQDKARVKKYFSHDLSFTGESMPLLCLLFSSCNLIEQESVGDIVRKIVGPEDPILARKTDPQSLRARFGVDKQRNVCFDVPFYRENVVNEMSLFFGSRNADILSAKGNDHNLMGSRDMKLGVRIGLAVHKYSPDTASSIISAMQLKVLDYLYSTLLSFSIVKSCQIISQADFSILLTKEGPAKSCRNITEDDNMNVSYFSIVIDIATCVSSSFVRHWWGGLEKLIQNSQPEHSSIDIIMQNSVSDSIKSNVLAQGSQYAVYQVLKDFAADDFKSHEDIGMQDTVEVSLSSSHHIMSLLKQLPCTCYAHIIGLRSDLNSLYILIRGYQLLENISYAANYLHSQNMQCYTAKGRKALENILNHYPVDSLFLDIALYDLYMSVPYSSTLLSYHALVQSPLSLHQNYSILDNVYNQNNKLSYQTIASAIFPPSSFDSLQVILVPYFDLSIHVVTRKLARIMRALNRYNFTVLGVQTALHLDRDVLEEIALDNYQQYKYDRQISKLSNITSQDSAYTMILVQSKFGKRLKHVLGPVLDEDLAMTSYPTSLAANLTTKDSRVCLLGVHSCGLVEKLIKEFFKEFLPSLWSVQKREEDASVANTTSSKGIESKVTHKIVEKTAVKTAGITNTSQLMQEIACVVLSSSLWSSNDEYDSSTAYLAELLDALHREQIGVVNARTIHLSYTSAKVLYNAAGQSSLTLRPTDANAFAKGPVLCLGLSGSSHAFVKLHSLVSSDRNKMKVHTMWQKGDEQVAALASSSSRLARELYCLCFDSICGQDVAFEIRREREDQGKISST